MFLIFHALSKWINVRFIKTITNHDTHLILVGPSFGSALSWSNEKCGFCPTLSVTFWFIFQEQIFDYTFSHLGINTEGCINHPMIITEALCNPNPFRQGRSFWLNLCFHVSCPYSYFCKCLKQKVFISPTNALLFQGL